MEIIGKNTLNQWATIAYSNAYNKGFHNDAETEDAFIERSCCNLVDEISELHTAWRENKLRELCDKAEKMIKLGIVPLTCLEEEIADIFLRLADISVKLGVDLDSVVVRKHQYNITREYRHGGKRS